MRRIRNPHLRDLYRDVTPDKKGRRRTNPDSRGTRPTGIPPAPQQLPQAIDPTHEQAELQALEQVVSAAVAGGLSTRTAVKLIAKEHVRPDGTPRWPHHQVVQTIRQIYEAWEQDFIDTAAKAREHQVARLREDLARMRSRANPPWSSVTQHEQLLARLLGTLQPVRVQVDVMQAVRVSIAGYIAEMTPDERDAMVAEQLQLEARARAIDVPAAAE